MEAEEEDSEDEDAPEEDEEEVAEEENADLAVENNPLTGTFYFKSVLDPSGKLIAVLK